MRIRFQYFVWMFVLATPGCLFHGGYPNGYNGSYGAGPSVLPPPQWGYPTQPSTQPFYTPGGAPTFQPGGSPTPLDGGNNGGTPSSNPSDWNTPQKTYGNDGGNNAPTFNPTTPGTREVPDPLDDPNSTRGPTSQAPGLTPTTSARTKPSSVSNSSYVDDNSNRQPRDFADENATESDITFDAPLVRPVSGNDEGDVQQANRTTLSSPESSRPYGHDPEFQWIKGVVAYDETTETWLIMYDDNPRPSDKLGGELTLAEHPSLKSLRPGDKVRVSGALDEVEADSRGKPYYQITRLKKQ
jgi:hypothetical protein